MNSYRFLANWLTIAMFLAITILAVGGVTRLTRSGLSITEWKPIHGTLPPIGEAAWNEAFAKYQATPEYIKVNGPRGMTVAEFKFIFFWEWFHRLLGRLLAVVVLIPFAVLAFSRKLSKDQAWAGALLLALVGLQGFLGWFMVKSGLVDMPRVSHYRLTIHLLAALTFISASWLLALRFRAKAAAPVAGYGGSDWSRFSLVVLALLLVQIIYGAFTAGLRAGVVSSTWPLMEGSFIPDGMGFLTPLVRNLSENPVAVHWIHRTLALVALTVSVLFALWGLRRPGVSRVQKVWLWHLLALAVVQVLVGIHVVLFRVPVSLASIHQILAVGLWLSALTLWWTGRRRA